jgi:hypothetical protein
VDCSDEAVANLALLNELLEAEMNFVTSGYIIIIYSFSGKFYALTQYWLTGAGAGAE